MSREVGSATKSPLRIRLIPPRPQANMLVRHQVSRLLDPAFSLVILEASAGYGKSTLLRQAYGHINDTGDLAVWLSMDDHNEDGGTFLTALIHAIADIGIDLGALQLRAVRGFARPEVNEAISDLIAALHDSGKAVTFFIDNLDNATDLLMPLIGALAEQLTGSCRFVVATRVHAAIGLAKITAAGLVDLLGPQDLRMSHDEGRLILQGYASPTDADIIIDRAEGWPVMIQLIRLSLTRQPRAHYNIAHFSGHRGELADYVAEQVIDDLPDALQTVLMELSICDRFNGDLLNWLCDRTDGWNLIEQFVRQGLLVVPIDAEAVWHRFHPIFAEFLVERLRRANAARPTELHQKAALWFAANAHLNDAIRHASAAGDQELTTRLLAESGGWLITFRGGTKALRIIAELPDAVLEAHPYLRLGQIYLLAQESKLRQARETFNALIERALPASFRSKDEETLFTISAGALDALLRVYEVKRVEPEKLIALRSLITPQMPKALAAMVTHLLGFAYYCDGNYPEARRVCIVAAEQCRAADADFVAVYSYLALGDSHLEMGELNEAENYFDLASNIAHSNFGADSNQVIAARIFLAEVAYERNDIELASSLIDSAIGGIEHRDPWSSVYMSAHRVASEIIQRRDGWKAAAIFLDQAAARLAQHELLAAYGPYLNVKKAEILTQAGLVGAASWPLRGNEALQPEDRVPQRSRSELLRMIASTRLTLLMGGGDVSLRQLNRMVPGLKARNQKRRLIKVYMLMAVAHHQQGHAADARLTLAEAVTLALPSGLIGPIVEEMNLAGPLLLADPYCAELLASIGIVTAKGITGDQNLATDAIIPSTPLIDGAGPRLSQRERQLLLLLADGLSGKEIANQINITLNTVMGYRKSLYRKLDTQSRSGAIAAGRMLGYLSR